jgi:hypothetical protein
VSAGTLGGVRDAFIPHEDHARGVLTTNVGGRRMSLGRPKDEGERWLSLSLMMLALTAGLFVTMAVIPSYWLYFADGVLKWTGKFKVPLGIRTLELPQQAIRDVIVSLWYGLVLVGAGLGVRAYNRRNPKVLPSGEDKREATGGYK